MIASKVWSSLLVALLVAGAASAAAPKTIAEAVIASKDDGLGVLLAAVQAANPAILEALSDKDAALTVFAPTDKAFKKLLEALDVSAEELLKDTELLTTVLKYHVIPAAVPAGALKRTQIVQTLLKGPEGKLKITKKERHGVANVRLYTTSGGTAKVSKADVKVGHSVIHIINHVLVPGSHYFPEPKPKHHPKHPAKKEHKPKHPKPAPKHHKKERKHWKKERKWSHHH